MKDVMTIEINFEDIQKDQQLIANEQIHKLVNAIVVNRESNELYDPQLEVELVKTLEQEIAELILQQLLLQQEQQMQQLEMEFDPTDIEQLAEHIKEKSRYDVPKEIAESIDTLAPNYDLDNSIFAKLQDLDKQYMSRDIFDKLITIRIDDIKEREKEQYQQLQMQL